MSIHSFGWKVKTPRLFAQVERDYRPVYSSFTVHKAQEMKTGGKGVQLTDNVLRLILHLNERECKREGVAYDDIMKMIVGFGMKPELGQMFTEYLSE